jgi:hypothetical protein
LPDPTGAAAMKAPLKLNSIDQEHLQELYDSTGVARDELPYSPPFEELCQGFQDRTFKNADPEQVYGALLKYVRSSKNAATELPASLVNDDQLKQLKAVLSRHLVGGKILPYSDEFKTAQGEFTKATGLQLSEQDFWRAILRLQGAKRRPPAARKKVAAKVEDDGDDDGE